MSNNYITVLSMSISLLLLSAAKTNSIYPCITVITGGKFITFDHEGVQRDVVLMGVKVPDIRGPDARSMVYGKEAIDFTINLIEGKTVRLEFDKIKEDHKGRWLAYVYLPDGTFVNAEIIKNGLGEADESVHCKYFSEFKKYEDRAKAMGIGMWTDYTKPKDKI